jgi:GntR family transcriptional regulator, transcriptional repressor for pyruvate dehydrogenase complex
VVYRAMPAASDVYRSFQRRRNLTGELIDRLTEEIVSGGLAPRTRLPTEHEMMKTFGVSRTVVREAIAALRAEGLVSTRQGSGAFVSDDPQRRPFHIEQEEFQSAAKVFDVMALRTCVEIEAAGLAAERRTKPSLARIVRASRLFSKDVASGGSGIDADFDFHAAIGAATENPYFLSFLEFIGRLIIPRRSVHVDKSNPAVIARRLKQIEREHGAIVRAIVDREVALARRAMRTHLTRSRDRYVSLIGKDGRRE